MNKQILLDKILSHLTSEHLTLVEAATSARAASTDEESIAETQYDTLAIEASYLAEGQANRAKALALDIAKLKETPLHAYTAYMPINIGALVQIDDIEKGELWFFITHSGAGFNTTINQIPVTIITTQSPLGKAMIGKQVDDEIKLTLAHKQLLATIIKVV
ncbi:GreA/GreB family elongation factor [Thalassotalea piscium]